MSYVLEEVRLVPQRRGWSTFLPSPVGRCTFFFLPLSEAILGGPEKPRPLGLQKQSTESRGSRVRLAGLNLQEAAVCVIAWVGKGGGGQQSWGEEGLPHQPLTHAQGVPPGTRAGGTCKTHGPAAHARPVWSQTGSRAQSHLAKVRARPSLTLRTAQAIVAPGPCPATLPGSRVAARGGSRLRSIWPRWTAL